MVIKYTKIFYCKTLKNLPKFGFFGLKTNHLATLMYMCTVCANKIWTKNFTPQKVDANNFPQKMYAAAVAQQKGKKNKRQSQKIPGLRHIPRKV
jgi:hypothetical protein